MNLSRLAVLAVFFMMVMSAFVTVPTYNVGADEHEGDDDGPFLNASPTGSGGDPEDYEMSVHSGEGGANITVEATELIDGVSYRIEWDISHLGGGTIASGDWNFTPPPGHVQYFIGPDILNEEDFDSGCYVFTGWLFEHYQILIEMESWVFTLDYPIEACNPNDVCPFNPDVVGSPCEEVDTNPCWGEGNHDTEACHDYVGEYCANHDDPGCYWDEGDGPSEAYIDANMVDLATWEIYVTTIMDPMWSDDMRAEIAHKCAGDLAANYTHEEITMECFNYWVADFSINEHHDVHYGDHGGDGCPPEMSEDLCAEFKEVCDDEENMNLSCFGFMVSYCDGDNADPMCEEFNSHDDDEFFVFLRALFDYEDGWIGPVDYLEIVDSLFDFEGSEDYGQSALYDAQTLTITTDEEGIYLLHPNFGSYSGSHNFICGNGDEIPFFLVNDDEGDCPDGADEQWYDSGTPNETSDDCQLWNDDECEGNFVNWYDCHDGSEIWVIQVNDGVDDCSEGEDEYHDADYGWWYGHVFLYIGHFNEVPDSTENLVGAASEVCDYVDDDEVYVFCELVWDGYMEAGDYTVVTAGGCYTEYNEEDDEEELHCEDYGDYNHSLTTETGDLVGWIEGAVEENDTLMTMTEEHHNARDDSRSNFPLYDAYELTVGDDGFNGSIISAHYNCSDHDGDGEYDEGCNNGYDMSIYIYEHSFDPAHSFENLMSSNDEIDGDGLDCPADEELFEEGEGCSYSGLQVDLTSGDYVVVTTSRGFSNDKGFYKNDLVRGEDGEIIETWDGDLIAPYRDCCDDDNNSFIVDGDDRTHMPWPWMYDDSDHGGDEGDDPFFEWTMQIIANLTAWKDDSLTAPDAADSIVDLVYWAAETGLLFDERGDGPSFICGNGDDEIPFDWVNNGVEDCADGSDEQQYDEDGQEINWLDCYDGSVVWIHQVNDGVEDCADGEDEGYYHDDGGEGEEDCPFDSPGFCHEIRPYCDNNDPYYDAWYCGSESAHYCMEDGASDVGCEEVVQSCESGDPDPNNEICDAFLNFDHDAYHGYGDDGTDDDSPVTLDGVAGVEDPADWDDMLTPSSENVVGILSDNEGLPIMLHSSFTITFSETFPEWDEVNEEHVFVIPSNTDCEGDLDGDGISNCSDEDADGDGIPDSEEYDDDGFDWRITFRVTEDYQINSCIGCDDISASMIHDDERAITFTMNDGATHDIIIAFVSAEDYCPFYSEAGMAFCVEQEEEGAPCSEDAERSEANGAACGHVVMDFCAENVDVGCAEFMDETVEFSALEWCNSEEFEDGADDWDRGFCNVLTAEPEPEPQPDCDHIIGLDSTGMAFDPVKLSIQAGETVCWQWTNAEMEHNVLELEGEYDATMNLTNINFGFSSGAPSTTVDFRHTFTKDNMTHYYVCEPHAATTGMVGQITVGEGSEVDPVQETLDESGLPGIGFVVGSLVLVGAAGLRRRIH